MIPDERPLIEATLKELCDVEGCSLVVTTGGTGPAPRDVTPEATEAVRDGGAHARRRLEGDATWLHSWVPARRGMHTQGGGPAGF